MSALLLSLRRLWCTRVHGAKHAMHPGPHVYRCRKCLCEFPVPWQAAPVAAQAERPARRAASTRPAWEER